MVRWLIIVFGSIYILAMWGILFYIIRRGLGPYFRSKRSEKISVKATIKHKLDHQDFHSLSWQVESVRKQMIFECEDGVERDYDVPDDVWDWTEQGDDGVLVYQGDFFVDFQARRPKLSADKAHERLMRR